MYRKLLEFKCDDCGSVVYLSSLADVLYSGWALSRGRRWTYCPKCAPAHRNVGRNGSQAGYKKKRGGD